MTCQHCQQQHPSYISYCSVSGQLIDKDYLKSFTFKTTEFCMNCGKSNNDNDPCCTNCGTSLYKLEEQRQGISKIFSQKSIANIPISGEKLTKHINADKLKSISKENIEYIKKKRFIFFPVLVTILLMLAFGFLMKDVMQEKTSDLANELDAEELSLFFNSEEITDELADEYGVDVKIPTFPYVSTLILFMHNINYSFSLDGDADYFYGYDNISIEGKLKNISYGFTIIASVIIAIGAIIYGVMARKERWDFAKGIIFSTIAYVLFMAIIAIIARYSIKLDIDEQGFELDLVGKIAPSILMTVLFSAILFTTIFSVVGFVAYHGKSTFSELQKVSIFIQYAVYALGITLVGIFIHIINLVISLNSDSVRLLRDFEWLEDSSANFIAAIYFAVLNWNANLFGKLHVTFGTGYYEEELFYKWFFNSSGENTREVRHLIEDLMIVHPIIFVVLLLAIIGCVGYFTFPTHKLSLKDVAIFASFFTVIQLFIVYFTGISLNLEMGEDVSLVMTYNYINTVFYSFIFAFVAFYAGGFIRQYLKK